MRPKALLSALLALFVSSCSCLVPLAEAVSARKHACCPAPAQAQPDSDCCLRGALPAAPVLLSPCAPRLLGVAEESPKAAAARQPLLLGAPTLAPPGAPPVFSRSSRAPPALLA